MYKRRYLYTPTPDAHTGITKQEFYKTEGTRIWPISSCIRSSAYTAVSRVGLCRASPFLRSQHVSRGGSWNAAEVISLSQRRTCGQRRALSPPPDTLSTQVLFNTRRPGQARPAGALRYTAPGSTQRSHRGQRRLRSAPRSPRRTTLRRRSRCGDPRRQPVPQPLKKPRRWAPTHARSGRPRSCASTRRSGFRRGAGAKARCLHCEVSGTSGLRCGTRWWGSSSSPLPARKG